MNPAEFANIARAEQRLWWYRGMNRILYRLIERYGPSGDVAALEAGSGTGFLATQLQQRFGWRMHALDLGAEGLRYGRRMGLQRLVQGDITALPFRNSSFDVLVSMDVLVHLPEGQEGRGVSELIRVVRPQGVLFVRVSALDILRSRHSMFAHERQRFTRKRLTQTFQQAGLDVLRCTYANSLLLPVALAKFRVWEPLMRAAPASGVAPVAPWLDTLLYQPLRLEQACIDKGINFPAGQSLFLVGRRRSG